MYNISNMSYCITIIKIQKSVIYKCSKLDTYIYYMPYSINISLQL